MLRCYAGKVLHVDLNEGRLTVEEPPESFYRKYAGGSGMGMYYILKNTPPGIDAFAPENTLTLFVGPATGMPVSGQARICANAKSPLTGAIGDAEAGGFFPAELKFAGFDGIVIRGKSPKPVYLWLHDGQAELRDASKLWGKITGEVEDILRDELQDPKIEVLQIGPAGEKLVRFACLINMCNRANGRTGMGAVMGSKNLKAVVVRGTAKSVKPAHPRQLSAVAKQGPKNLAAIPDMQGLSANGTSDGLGWQNDFGTLPTRNWNEGQFEHFQNLTGQTMTDTILKERDTCFGCIIRCKRVVETEFDGRKVVPRYGGPEYETLSTLGSYCGVAELSAVALGNQICNQYGIDTISGGATVAFAMECFENGLLSAKDTGGIELKFGNAKGMLRLLEMIAKREGLGDLLAEGTARAAAKIGNNAADYLITAKGQEAPAHMPHAKKSLGLIYAVNPFGADHQSSEHDPTYEEGAFPLYPQRLAMLGLTQPQDVGSMNEEKVRFAYLTQLFFSAMDTYSICQFVWGPTYELYGPDETVEMLRAVTGWDDLTLDEVLKVGERRLNMMRAFNAREGMGREQDKLAPKFARPLQGTGRTAGVFIDPAEMEHFKDFYYGLAGWEVSTGVPSPAKLASLGLEWIKL